MPSIFDDNMVLQRHDHVSVWGTDRPNTLIKVSGSWDEEATVRSGNSGEWKVKIKTPEAGGPYTLTVEGSTKKIFKDVLIGEVWLCSGQSNMEMPLKGYKNQPIIGSNEAILNATNNQIRLFNVKRRASLEPLNNVAGSWEKSNPLTAKEFSAVAYFFGNKINELLNVPIGLINTSWGSSNIESWMDKETLSEYKIIEDLKEVPEDKPQKSPYLLYNGMLHPLQNFTLKGFIWYQGEANRFNAEEYSKLFPAMIQQWRSQWNQGDLPFYFVQIAPFGYKGMNAGYLREAQLKTMLTVNNTGMAVSLDAGDCNRIHPAQKRKVGERLAYWALSKNYGFDGITFLGPVYEKMDITNDGKIKLYFKFSENGFLPINETQTGFQIAGPNKIFYPAKAVINRDGTISVFSEEVPNPVAVRYAFESCPEATLFNTAGLPASSFRTDDWDD
ncbi:sialate O-acetylesterase [Gaetbulibacter aestuarii]